MSKFSWRLSAVALIVAIASPQVIPQKADAQAELLIPAVCATGIGCVLLGTIVIGGVAYLIWQNTETGSEYGRPIESGEYLEDPEDGTHWGEYSTAKTKNGCRYLAGGRPWQWDAATGKCYIKG
jgi:hypothetical protein